jgi:uncharacterized protein (DUF362 family)/Pyruvate/2-oxoacid:ferredoxin oxidoreductase delta subunit
MLEEAAPPPARSPALVSHVTASYGPGLEATLERAVAPFGGWGALVRPGERIAVKVNLLRSAAPEKVVTTNPETLRAVLRALLRVGATPFVADSPGGPGARALVMRAYKQSGIMAVCEQEGVEAVHADAQQVELAAPNGKLFRAFTICKCFADADGIVQVGPLKTHGLMRLTGGVKLTFGCIPGLLKAQLHVKAKQRRDFADMLIDLHEAIAPRFTVIDAIVAMEGKGPGSGTPRRMDSLFAARDAHALDAALADRTAHEYRHVYTLAAAAERGLIDLKHPYELVGDPVAPDTGFIPSTQDFDGTAHEPAGLLRGAGDRFARDLLTAKPRLVNEAACTRCGNCVEVCGVEAITLAPTPVYDYDRCVLCYACTEICPTAAISEVAPRPARLLRLFRRS